MQALVLRDGSFFYFYYFLIKDCLTQVKNADGIITVLYDIIISDEEMICE